MHNMKLGVKIGSWGTKDSSNFTTRIFTKDDLSCPNFFNGDYSRVSIEEERLK